MAWDPALLRKYNTTSHFRLLNQIRTELRDQPIQRPLVTSRSAAGGSGGGGGGGGGGRRGGRSTAAAQSAAGSAAGSAAASFTPAASSHANTRRRSAAASQQPSPSAVRDHQPIVAVPVLTDVVMPDSHT